MSWLTYVHAEKTIAWLLIASIVAAVSGIISSYLTYHLINRREIIDTVVADIQRKNIFVTIESENEKKERIRREVARWANPILGAVQDLEYRLNNILYDGGNFALSSDYCEEFNSDWSILYE